MKSNQKDDQRSTTSQSGQLQKHNQNPGNRYDEVELKKVNEHLRKLKQVNRDLHSVSAQSNPEVGRETPRDKRRREGQDENRSERKRDN